MSRAVPFLWIVVAVLFAPAEGEACSCLGSAPPCQAVWDSPIVFAGEVIDITKVQNGRGDQFMPERRVRFRVEDVWRGPKTPEIAVMTGSGGGDCGYNFEPGVRYLVYTHSRGGVPWTGICTRTRRLDSATEDLRYLANLQAASPHSSIFGTATWSRGSGTKTSKPATAYGVTIRRDGREWKTKTDADGRYAFSGVEPGTYDISIDAQPGERVYAARTVEVRDARGCGQLDFSIAGSGAVTLRVLNAQGQPVSGFDLEIIDAETLQERLPSYRHATSGNDGRASFKELPPGRYVIVSNFRLPPSRRQPFWRLFHPGTSNESAATVIALQQGQHLDLEPLVLPEPRSERVLRGVVVWPDGTPVARAWVTALPVNTVHYAGDVWTSADGTFSLQLLEGVAYAIGAVHWGTPSPDDDWMSPDVEVRLMPENRAVTLVLQPFRRK